MRATPTLAVHVVWRSAAPASEATRARILRELEAISLTLNAMEALLHDAHALSDAQHAWLLPKLELNLPLYDEGLRYKLVLRCLDRPQWTLHDDRGRGVADVRLP